jgi:hypothetical protein
LTSEFAAQSRIHTYLLLNRLVWPKATPLTDSLLYRGGILETSQSGIGSFLKNLYKNYIIPRPKLSRRKQTSVVYLSAIVLLSTR